MIKRITGLLLILVLLLSGCSKHKYDIDWIIGKNSDEIVEKYGDFDTVSMPKSHIDGLYHNSSCSYVIKEKKVGYLGTTPEQLFTISFDENSFAKRCFEETGGKGG